MFIPRFTHVAPARCSALMHQGPYAPDPYAPAPPRIRRGRCAGLACAGVVLDRLAAEHLPLSVLRSLAALFQPVLLPLLAPGVPGHEAALLQGRAVLRAHQNQRPGHAE